VGREFFNKLLLRRAQPNLVSEVFRVLWVDDYPGNNSMRVDLLSNTLGVEFELARSTKEALSLIQHQTFHAIISDLGRDEEEWAGLDLIRALKIQGNQTPIAIFASKRAVENRTILLEAGAQVATNVFGDIRDWIETLLSPQKKPKDPGFWVLWVDDQPENNTRFQKQMTELMFARFVTARDTGAALNALKERDFDLIVSYLGRGSNLRAGVDTLKIIREQGVQTRVAFFTRSNHALRYQEEMASLGVTDVVSGREKQQEFVGKCVMEKEGKLAEEDAAAFLAELERESTAVCRITDVAGKLRGTGFLTRDGYLFTSNSVIGSAKKAANCYAEFGYKMREDGNASWVERYSLDTEDFITSPVKQLNFTRVRIKAEPSYNLRRWGYIEFEDSAIQPVGEKLSLIHYPESGLKAIEANSLEVIGQLDNRLYYTPITSPNSEGAPVLNKDLKAVALHLVGYAYEEGFFVNEKGDKRDTGMGVLIRYILKHIQAVENLKEAKKIAPKLSRAEALAKARAARDAKAADPFQDLMIHIKGGTFEMGDTFGDGESNEKPIHLVNIPDFQLCKYPVTQAQWKKIMGDNPAHFKGDELPVEQVSWDDAQAFLKKLNAQTGQKYRLPSEAEWEYAAREGGKKVRFGNGKEFADPKDINFNASEKYKKIYSVVGEFRNKTTPVNQFTPNDLGLYDMSGNVWEWCGDWYDEKYYSKSDGVIVNPSGPSSEEFRVLRGGSWLDYPSLCRAADHDWNLPYFRYNNIGFRVARGY